MGDRTQWHGVLLQVNRAARMQVYNAEAEISLSHFNQLRKQRAGTQERPEDWVCHLQILFLSAYRSSLKILSMSIHFSPGLALGSGF